MHLKLYSSMKKKFGKLRIIFDIENWLWKSEIGTFWSLDLDVRWSTKKLLRWKSAIYHSIKLPFDVEVDEKFLNGMYLLVMDLIRIIQYDLGM